MLKQNDQLNITINLYLLKFYGFEILMSNTSDIIDAYVASF